ncbi:uncharacterized protein [Euwallacea fornicatus]|uniref:uncharacterized protein isoform X2 n=1 Tax=Euwallacea fornicatus TaxID=995702 RepID=UPI00338EBC86
MKLFFGLFLFVLLLCDLSTAKRSGGRTKTRSSSGGSGFWGRKKSDSSTGSANPRGHETGQVKPSAPIDYSRKQTSQVQQNKPIGWNTAQQSSNDFIRKESSSHVNAPKSPNGWNVPGQTSNVNDNRRNPAWDSPGNKGGHQQLSAKDGNNPAWGSAGSKSSSQQNSPAKGWSSGYQNHNQGQIKKETAKVQQSAPPGGAQPPAPGWNVQGQNKAANNAPASGWNSGYQTNSAPPSYHQNAAPPGYNGHTSWGAPPAYPGAHGYGGYGNGYHQPGGYGGYSGYGGYHPQQQSFGGFNPGYGGMGGYGGGFGGHGGSGFGGYAPAKKSSFFSASTIGNVVAGMLVYNMASNLISYGLGLKRPYNVVNYYNQEPNKKIEEIKLPTNILTLCEGDVNKMCGQGTQAICTQNGTVLCAATTTQPTPCEQGGNKALCVNTTVPCIDANDPLCQNSTLKDKLQAEVNVPCLTNVTLDVNLLDKDQTAPNTKYTYCVTTMAVAGPEYKICEEYSNSNDYRSVLNENYEWFLETDEGFRRNYSVYTHKKPMESNGQINMPVTVLLKCSDNAKRLCPPGTIATCTTFNEVMCMAAKEDVQECAEFNTTCAKSTIPCPEGNKDKFCEKKIEGSDSITMDIPCFANISLNAPFPKFNLAEFNGTLPDVSVTTSYTYNFEYCVMTLALAGSDFDMCITKEAKEKQGKT